MPDRPMERVAEIAGSRPLSLPDLVIVAALFLDWSGFRPVHCLQKCLPAQQSAFHPGG